MWAYEKRLQFPVNIKKRDLKMALDILTQYGGPNGELAAALRYLNQRYTMPDDKGKALLSDIGTEESAHTRYKSNFVVIFKRNLSSYPFPPLLLIYTTLSIIFFKALFLSSAVKRFWYSFIQVSMFGIISFI